MTDALADLRMVRLPFDIDNVAPQCHQCIRDQLEKYDKYVNPNTEEVVSGKFLVPCAGIPKHTLDPSLKAAFEDDVWEELEAIGDIVKWAAKYLTLDTGEPWIARSYQETILRCTSKRKMLRCARRLGKTSLVCIEICYKMFTNDNRKIIVVGPQKTHAEEIINRVRGFIRRNSDLSRMVVRDVSAPYYEVKLSNGSRVRGFAGGTKGNKEGVSVRGQDGHDCYLEEMDYIDDDAITGAVLPILQTTPDTNLIGFSTPSGFKTTYRRFCEENPYYKEYHYDYKMLAHWRNIEMERSSMTNEKWEHEQLAIFGASEAGVYKPAYIDKALRVYEYGDHARSYNWRYCIGTDWNEQHGTEIVVLGYSPITTRFQIVDALLVPKSEFTQLTGVAKLLEMNKKWQPSFVYIDAGGGSTNYELLMAAAQKQQHKHGDRDTARLITTLKKYNAGSAIDVKDPITKQKHREPAKPFMVNASIRMFEQQQIIISSSDHVLESQLRNYIIKRYSPTKVPVYGLEDEKVKDHRLDALNLAIVAFHLEFDDLYVTQNVNTMIAVPDPRLTNAMNDERPNSGRQLEDHKQTISRPEDRRLIDVPVHLNMPSSRPDTNYGIKTNRRGWDTDQEEERMSEYLQRKRSRGKVQRDRPKRNSF